MRAQITNGTRGTRCGEWCRVDCRAMIGVMASSLNLADTVVLFLALVGPQKVLLSFARIARTLDQRSLRLVALLTACAAAGIGTACALTAPWLATFFHISTASLELAAGLVFFIYAVGLVLGIHFDPAERVHVPSRALEHEPGAAAAARAPASPAPDSSEGPDHGGADEAGDPQHPLTSGFRALLLPFVVSPLAVAAALQLSLSARDWGDRWAVVVAFTVVAFFNAGCAIVFGPLLGRAHATILEMLSRLLGVLLTAVGVQLFLLGLEALGVHLPH
jgi:multiple antibiotic resistance protein